MPSQQLKLELFVSLICLVDCSIGINTCFERLNKDFGCKGSVIFCICQQLLQEIFKNRSNFNNLLSQYVEQVDRGNRARLSHNIYIALQPTSLTWGWRVCEESVSKISRVIHSVQRVYRRTEDVTGKHDLYY